MERPRVSSRVDVRPAPMLPELLVRLLGFLSISLAAGLFAADVPLPVILVSLAPALVALAFVVRLGIVPPRR
ncbi:MAG: hypothetical protein WD116_02020 [Chloroflexota bacterium]